MSKSGCQPEPPESRRSRGGVVGHLDTLLAARGVTGPTSPIGWPRLVNPSILLNNHPAPYPHGVRLQLHVFAVALPDVTHRSALGEMMVSVGP